MSLTSLKKKHFFYVYVTHKKIKNKKIKKASQLFPSELSRTESILTCQAAGGSSRRPLSCALHAGGEGLHQLPAALGSLLRHAARQIDRIRPIKTKGQTEEKFRTPNSVGKDLAQML